MIESVKLKDFGPIADLSYSPFGKINLFIGPNRSGKTTLLKTLYAVRRSMELSARDVDAGLDDRILAGKLTDTFRVNGLAELVHRPYRGDLQFSMTEKGKGEISFKIAADGWIKVSSAMPPVKANSVFMPAKEVLSLIDIIRYHREHNTPYGFDDTYYDLVLALEQTPKDSQSKSLAAVRKKLEESLGGSIAFNRDRNRWEYRQCSGTYDIGITSEGTKKLGIFDALIANRFLSRDSAVFIDEPEVGLHPGILVKMIDIIAMLARAGMQFFISSHSYFVIKKLYLIAQQQNCSIPVISFNPIADTSGEYFETATVCDLRDGMPDNPIIEESIRLYEEELSL